MFIVRLGGFPSAVVVLGLALTPAALAQDEDLPGSLAQPVFEDGEGVVALTEAEMGDLRGLGFLDDLLGNVVEATGEGNTAVVQVGGSSDGTIEDSNNENDDIATIGGVTTVEQGDLPISLGLTDGRTSLNVGSTTAGVFPGLSPSIRSNFRESFSFHDTTSTTSNRVGF